MSPNPLPLSNPNLLKQQCFMKDGWHDASDGTIIEVTNPFSGDVIGTIPSLTTQDMLEAVTYSHDVQVAWAAKTPQERAVLLQKWADLIDANKEDLATNITPRSIKAARRCLRRHYALELTSGDDYPQSRACLSRRLYDDYQACDRNTIFGLSPSRLS